MLTRTAEYALRAVVGLAGAGGGPLTAARLAEATGVPAPYLAKVLRELARRGLVRSARGAGGGFVLALAADRISVLDVVDAVTAGRRGAAGAEVGPGCPGGLRRRIDAGLAMAERLYACSTIAELVDAAAAGGGPPGDRRPEDVGEDRR